MAIADKLGRRSNELCLNGWSIPVDFKKLDKEQFFHLGKDLESYKKLRDYFALTVFTNLSCTLANEE